MRSFRARPVGWRNESYRHYLASKGVKTSKNGYYLKGWFEGSLVPFSLNMWKKGIGASIDAADGSYHDTEKNSAQQWWVAATGPKKDIAEALGMKKYKLAAINPQPDNLPPIDPGDYVLLGFLDGRMQQVWVKVKVFRNDWSSPEFVGIVDEHPVDPKEIGVDKGSRVVFREENILDMRNVVDMSRQGTGGGWQDTSSHEGAKQYVERNLKSNFQGTPEDRVRDFARGVREMALTPMHDYDEEWEEFSTVAGKPELLSDDPMERWSQRGAAIFGRVITQANVEPIVDYHKDRNFREIMMDIAFGRRA